MKNFSTLIPALNEADNIGGLIDDILGQYPGDSLELEKVIVVSDGSTDGTDEIVRSRAATDPRIELLVNPRTMGKPQCLNIGMRHLNSDFLVLLDADVRLSSQHTLQNLLEGFDLDVGLVGGCLIPTARGNGFASLISRCSDMLLINVQKRIRGGSNIFSARGPIMALSRSFYSDIEIPLEKEGRHMMHEDQYLYLSCIGHGLRYLFRGDAEVCHKPPSSFKEYLRGSARYAASARETAFFFDGRDITREYHIPLGIKVKAFADLCCREPVGALAWIAFRIGLHAQLLLGRLGWTFHA